jgi:RNA polymerase sigma factor (sigma-70 family)
MRTTGMNQSQLVVAAQSGDPAAREDLVAISLPLVYSIVGRALGEHPDVDDVVQDTMVRVVRDLPALREPDSFRAWLSAIAVRQVGTHVHRRRIAAARRVPLEDAVAVPDPISDVEDLTIVRQDLSDQRRQVGRAGRWLSTADRLVLSLWWLETAGELTRAELAAALGTSPAHAAVRVQRMRERLESGRTLVAALERTPRCAALGAVVRDWDGVPSPLWRKRIARHVGTCAVCGSAGAGLMPTERLLVGFGLLVVPLALSAALRADALLVAASTALRGAGAAGAKAGMLAQLASVVAAHPAAALVAVGILVSGTAVTWSAAERPRTSAVGAPPATIDPTPLSGGAVPFPFPSASGARTVPLGPVSLESADRPGQYVSVSGRGGALAAVGPTDDVTTRRQATFEAVPGLADPACVSLRTPDGKYVRHASWRLWLDTDSGTALFRGDATFCARAGTTTSTVSLESSNYRGFFLRNVGEELWVDQSDGSAAFRQNSAFWVRPPLA